MVETKKIDPLEGWEGVLEEYGYTRDPQTGNYENWELRSCFSREIVYENFKNLADFRAMISRFANDSEFRESIYEGARFLIEEIDRQLGDAASSGDTVH